MWPEDLILKTKDLLSRCRDQGFALKTMESCTGGLISALITEIPGASNVFLGGYVPYSNVLKQHLGVPEALLKAHGAVSQPVAKAMAEAAITRPQSTHSKIISMAVTGIAGPGGGTPDRPVGLVFLCAARMDGKLIEKREIFDGTRQEIRLKTAATSINMLSKLIHVMD